MNKVQQDISERLVAEVPRELKRQATAKAALEGKKLKDVLIELLTTYVGGGITALPPK
jgi:hypothetical protein